MSFRQAFRVVSVIVLIIAGFMLLPVAFGLHYGEIGAVKTFIVTQACMVTVSLVTPRCLQEEGKR